MNLKNNLGSDEMYKHIWLTLLLNPSVMLDVDDPVELRQRANYHYFALDNDHDYQAD